MTNYIRSYWTQRAAKAVLITSIALSLAASDARGTTRYWQGTAGNYWSTPANWSPAGPPQDGDDLFFINRVSNNIINDLPSITVHSMIFYQAFGLSGNPMTVTSEIACFATDAGVDIGVDGLYLGGNTYLNAVYKELDLDTYIELGGYTLTATGYNGNYLDFPGEISGAGNFVLGGGTAYLDAFNGNNVNGSFLVEGGTLVLDSLYGGAVNTNLEVWSGATVSTMKGFQIYAPSVLIQPSGQILLNNTTNSFTTIVMQGGLIDSGPGGLINLINGPLQINATSETARIAGNLSVRDNIRPIEVNGPWSPGLDLAANVRGIDFTKTGLNLMQISGNNTFTGYLQIDAGTVQPTSAAALSPSSVGVILNGGNLQMQGLTIGNEPLYVNSPNSTLIAYDACSWSGPVTLNADFNVLPADTTSTGKAMNFTGVISGSGGMTMLDSPSYNGTLLLSGSSANTYTGTTTVYGRLLELGKLVFVNACSGPIVVGGGSAAVSEARWLHNYQNQFAALTLYANGYVNLINHDENFGPVTFNGGLVDSTGGQFAIYAPLTVNPSSSTATINGVLGLAPGLPPSGDAVINVGAGSTASGVDLLVNAVAIGGAPYLDKQGAGTMSLTAANTFTGVTLLEAGIIAMGNGGALSGQGVVIYGGATLRMDVNGTMNQGMELSGTGVGGTHGALEVSPGVNFSINGDCLLDAATTLNVGSGGTLQLGGALYGAGPLTKIGTGLLVLYGIGANTYSGDTLINQGTLTFGKGGSAKAIPGNLVIGTRISLFGNSGTTATVTDVAYYGIGGPNVTVNGGSLWDLGGYAEQIVSVNLVNGGSIHTSGGVLGLDGSTSATAVTVGPGKSGASVISGNLSFYNGGNCSFVVGSKSQFLVGSPPELDIQATISDSFAGSFRKTGTGEMRLSSANTLNSTMTINDGKVTVRNSAGLGTSSASVTVNTNGALSLDGGLTINNKALTLNSSNSAGAFQTVSGSNTWGGLITLSQNTGISVNPAGGYLQVPNTVSGPAGLTKLGLGTLQFWGSPTFAGSPANTYAGLTTVSAGLLECGRQNSISIPGDAVIGDDSTTVLTATLHATTEQQINPLANVTIHKSGFLNVATGFGLFQVNQTLRTISGYGPISLGNPYVSSLIVSNDVACEYFGAVSGLGAFYKYGSGTLTTWGDFSTTGDFAIAGGDWRFNGTRHNGDIGVGSGGRLRGDGSADQFVYLGGHFAVDSRFPDHRGSTFRMGSFYAYPTSVIELDMFGPSPTGGNDKLSTGSVLNGLSGVTLSTSFSYPPHDGDVITLINVTNGPAYSAFSNYPAGVVTLVGTVPVVPSYTGGSGHDFTLTVTNLALAYFGYRLAEGNGNQTVEPNECNLLYVSLLNRRSSALTITNAFLRATNTIGVLVTIPVTSFPTIPAGQAAECLTPFQFSTDTNLACGASVGFELVVGAVNEGQFAIAFNPVSGDDCTHPTGPCESCTVVSGQFNASTLTTTQALYFVGAPSICYPPKAYPGIDPTPGLPPFAYLTHTHSFTNTTTNGLCLTAQLQFDCPSAPTNALGVAAYLGGFNTNDPSAGYLGDLGQGGPPYPGFSFQVPAGSNFVLVVMARATNLVCNSYSLELFGLPCPPPTLAIQPELTPAKVRVNWSTAYPGFTAQQSGQLGGTFVNAAQTPVILNSRYALTNLPALTNQFYRLKK